ncbi:MAG: tryptophan synthase alpha chain [Flavobacteriales bacterium]|jgi:tryptophan synthase alpha chain
MERIKELFRAKKDILSVYFTAGYPNIDDTGRTILSLQKSGVDLIEVGMPYSDPMADGETIQQSSAQALKNGMTLDLLFNQLKQIKKEVNVPLVFMGYLNQWMRYGKEKFCKAASEAGISAFIIPDLPMEIYQEEYKSALEKYNLGMSFLITPQTNDARIQQASEYSSGFLYIVSQSSTTGGSKEFTKEQLEYFDRIHNLNLKTPKVIGFAINSGKSYREACKYANGAIIGSGFIRALEKDNLEHSIKNYIDSILTDN